MTADEEPPHWARVLIAFGATAVIAFVLGWMLYLDLTR